MLADLRQADGLSWNRSDPFRLLQNERADIPVTRNELFRRATTKQRHREGHYRYANHFSSMREPLPQSDRFVGFIGGCRNSHRAPSNKSCR